ncbi:MAG: hypothetical protein HY543_06200 [Deltaproteobacteria bacterium]|nr:hypothetical protein [Deltaproteobacteria bacterium]
MDRSEVRLPDTHYVEVMDGVVVSRYVAQPLTVHCGVFFRRVLNESLPEELLAQTAMSTGLHREVIGFRGSCALPVVDGATHLDTTLVASALLGIFPMPEPAGLAREISSAIGGSTGRFYERPPQFTSDLTAAHVDKFSYIMHLYDSPDDLAISLTFRDRDGYRRPASQWRVNPTTLAVPAEGARLHFHAFFPQDMYGDSPYERVVAPNDEDRMAEMHERLVDALRPMYGSID